MTNLQHREEKMQTKAKSFTFRQFVQRICSWEAMNFYKYPEGITIYPDTPRRGTLIPPSKYEALRDDFLKYGRDYDFGKTFRENFGALYHEIPRIAIRVFLPIENSDYVEAARRGLKNCYLTIGAGLDTENILYCFEIKENCKNILNSTMVRNNTQNVYRSTAVLTSYNIFYSRLVNNCSDIRFSSNMIGCHECILCSDLMNQSYCIKNKTYPKEEYLVQKEELLRQKYQFMTWYASTKTDASILSKNITGHCMIESKNVKDGLYSYRMRNSQNVFLAGTVNGNDQNVNVMTSGAPYFDKIYNVLNSGEGSNVYSSDYLGTCSNVYYTYFLENCSYCIGCVGLKNKQFCILNKEYPKEQRYELIDKIFAQMDKEGVLGDFFPGYLNPLYFNDTAAYLIDDTFTKEEVAKDGYMRREGVIKVDIPQGADIVETQNLASYEGFDSQGTWTINPEILKKVIKDEQGNCYRIVKMEYDFLMKHGLPLPRLHRLDRIKLGFRFK